ncbi:type II CAAX prenyl endopeptidase Rce1 family protein [Paenibacillus silvae]|uniref:type II CAAX endopeptidase family protein n=1 Tax=Paenibacillus TaxID=44249 RepID=UPI001C126A3B|nr:type II CAAX endopeptidase family protein [Paenibacillus barcinonensis]MBU5352596.1 CPBP family intramembrane metalloprotease [Paenibacillus barcinonensis]
MINKLTMKSAGWVFFVSYATGIVLTAWMNQNGNQHHENLMWFLGYVMVGQIIINLLPAIMWCYYQKLSFRTVFRLHKVSLRNVLLSLVIFALSQVILLFLHQVTEVFSLFIGVSYETSSYPVANSLFSFCILLLSIGIIPPICEELLFRGALITGFEKRGLILAAVMSSFLFALFHDNPYRLVELFASALVSSLLVIKSGSIIPGIIVHLITNSSFVINSYLIGGDMLESITKPEGPSGSVMLITGCAALIVFFVCKWLFTLFDSPKKDWEEEKMKKKTAFSLSSFGWFLPILLSVLIFIFKFIYL